MSAIKSIDIITSINHFVLSVLLSTLFLSKQHLLCFHLWSYQHIYQVSSFPLFLLSPFPSTPFIFSFHPLMHLLLRDVSLCIEGHGGTHLQSQLCRRLNPPVCNHLNQEFWTAANCAKRALALKVASVQQDPLSQRTPGSLRSSGVAQVTNTAGQNCNLLQGTCFNRGVQRSLPTPAIL